MWVSELPFVFICVISFHSFLLFLALLSTTLDQVYLLLSPGLSQQPPGGLTTSDLLPPPQSILLAE